MSKDQANTETDETPSGSPLGVHPMLYPRFAGIGHFTKVLITYPSGLCFLGRRSTAT